MNYQKERIKRIVSLIKIKEKDKVLDIGCGDEYIKELMNIKDYTGIDLIEKRMDALIYLKHTKKKYSVALMIDFVEHIPPKELHKIFTHLRKKLKGTLYIHTPDADFIFEKIKRIFNLQKRQGHINVMTERDLTIILKESGFKNVKVTKLSHYIPCFRILGKKTRLFIEAK